MVVADLVLACTEEAACVVTGVVPLLVVVDVVLRVDPVDDARLVVLAAVEREGGGVDLESKSLVLYGHVFISVVRAMCIRVPRPLFNSQQSIYSTANNAVGC